MPAKDCILYSACTEKLDKQYFQGFRFETQLFADCAV